MKKPSQPTRCGASFLAPEDVGSSIRYVISEGAYGRLHASLYLTDCDRCITWSSPYRGTEGHKAWRAKLEAAANTIDDALLDLARMEAIVKARKAKAKTVRK